MMLFDFLVIWIYGTILMVNFYRITNIWIGFNKNLTLFYFSTFMFCKKNFFILYSTLWLVSFTNSEKKYDLDKFKLLFSSPMLHAFTFKSTHLFLMLAFSIKTNMQHTPTKKRVHIFNFNV